MNRLTSFAVAVAVTLAGLGHALPQPSSSLPVVDERSEHRLTPRAFPGLPLHVEGSNIIDADGDNVKFAGTNWPGHGAPMIPEGLQYQSAEYIASKIRSVGINTVRLTFAIEMVDDIYANGGQDVDLRTTFTNSFNATTAEELLAAVLENNPDFTEATTRLEVFDKVAASLNSEGIYVILDNHISRAQWCCSGTDGNTWWGDVDFDAENWARGLAYMAEHVAQWPNLAGVSLRNELREPTNNAPVLDTYNWQTWYQYIRQGADAVHNANPDALVILSGLNYDTTLQPVVRGQALSPGSEVFSLDAFSGYADKLVLELHNYNREVGSCDDLWGGIYNGGAQAMNPDEASTAIVLPVLLTEFGFPQDGAAFQTVYATCLAERLPEGVTGWMQWAVAGSYYTRQDIDDYDETWGLLTHDWADWRDPAYVEQQLTPMVADTL